MLSNLILSISGGEEILSWIEISAIAIEIIAVAIIVFGIFFGLLRYLYESLSLRRIGPAYNELKRRLGRTLLLGLEILVAADIVRTVALEATLESVLVLGLLVLIRTFLSWAVVVEIESRWPWQEPHDGVRIDIE